MCYSYTIWWDTEADLAVPEPGRTVPYTHSGMVD